VRCLVTQQHRQVGVTHHVAGDPTEQQLPQRRMLIGSHYQHVRAEFVRPAQQCAAERRLTMAEVIREALEREVARQREPAA